MWGARKSSLGSGRGQDGVGSGARRAAYCSGPGEG